MIGKSRLFRESIIGKPWKKFFVISEPRRHVLYGVKMNVGKRRDDELAFAVNLNDIVADLRFYLRYFFQYTVADERVRILIDRKLARIRARSNKISAE
jgi:hypothetical protein